MYSLQITGYEPQYEFWISNTVYEKFISDIIIFLRNLTDLRKQLLQLALFKFAYN